MLSLYAVGERVWLFPVSMGSMRNWHVLLEFGQFQSPQPNFSFSFFGSTGSFWRLCCILFLNHAFIISPLPLSPWEMAKFSKVFYGKRKLLCVWDQYEESSIVILCGVGEKGCCISCGGMPNGVSHSQVK